jgi:hypothetical protein
MSRRKKAQDQPIDWNTRLQEVCLANSIEARYYDGSWRPYCWNVKLHASPSFDAVFTKMGESFFICKADAVVSTPNMQRLKDQWQEEYDGLYTLAVEDMCGFFTGREAETRGHTSRMIRPKIADKYKLSSDVVFSAVFNFYGRSGGWLSLERFEGVTLRTVVSSPDHGFIDIDDVDWMRSTCAYLEEVSLMTAAKVRDDELIYQLAFHMNRIVEEQREAL